MKEVKVIEIKDIQYVPDIEIDFNGKMEVTSREYFMRTKQGAFSNFYDEPAARQLYSHLRDMFGGEEKKEAHTKGFIVGVATSLTTMLTQEKDDTIAHEILRGAGLTYEDFVKADCT